LQTTGNKTKIMQYAIDTKIKFRGPSLKPLLLTILISLTSYSY
jgi:hypothetical protein